ncbi:MAG: patatin-like phospholipase family protein [Methylobacter sp.]|nr:patatin-like phospholipase family protein [Methylobacter sp.]
MVDQIQQKKEQYISDAKVVLNGEVKTTEYLLELATKLLDFEEFSWARGILELAVKQDNNQPGEEISQKIAQKRALATYKDPQLHREKALDQAIEILREAFDLVTTTNQETLGLAGAIYKRRWEVQGNKVNLERALAYYERGFNAGVEGDDGYTAINAAFIQDLLVYIAEKQATDYLAFLEGKRDQNVRLPKEELTGNFEVMEIALSERRKKAVEIRLSVINFLSEKLKNINTASLDTNDYWPVSTLAEAYFGTGNYQEAGKWLNLIKQIPHLPSWQPVSTAKRLVQLARYQARPDISDQDLEESEAWKTLLDYIGAKANPKALCSMYRGKLGLALSGGGFRASLYHIGVLAKLAEYDLLRHIEVISSVSGGSIIGAHYYLELRRLFNVEKKADAEITREDYIKLVETIADDFLAGVQENPRVSLLANPWYNLKLVFSLSYSRTLRLGELYEKLIYSRIKDNEGTAKRWLNELYIYPPENPRQGGEKFLPRRDNWSRLAKIPELVLNATTLNTGHNWQYTASWMGESPATIDTDVDGNDRYRRTYYYEAPDDYKNMRLGSAVGASSCVPGIFEPLILNDLYEDFTVRLVDGGIFDNQGIESLLEQDCDIIISSDASGQLNTEKDPGGGIVKPVLRSNNTVMQRVRNSQFEDLKERARSGIIKGFAFVHLKQGLEGDDINVVNSTEPPKVQPDPNARTTYGIRKDIQKLLANIRTDLDSFSDIEAYALMTSGYCAMEPALSYLKDLFPLDQDRRRDWKFLQLEPAMTQSEGSGEALARLKTNLNVSPMKFGKVWKLYKPLRLTAMVLIAALLIALIAIWLTHPGWKPFSPVLSWLGNSLTINIILGTLVMLLIFNFIMVMIGAKKAKFASLLLSFRDLPWRIIAGLGIGLVGWIFAFIHLKVFDKWFKAVGKVPL